jgi:hypothetical protein
MRAGEGFDQSHIPPYREAYERRFRTPGTKFCAFMDEVLAKLPPPAAETRKPL